MPTSVRNRSRIKKGRAERRGKQRGDTKGQPEGGGRVFGRVRGAEVGGGKQFLLCRAVTQLDHYMASEIAEIKREEKKGEVGDAVTIEARQESL